MIYDKILFKSFFLISCFALGWILMQARRNMKIDNDYRLALIDILVDHFKVIQLKTPRPNSFVDLLLQDKTVIGDIDDFIDSCHEESEDLTLAEHLGFSQQEYELWAEKDIFLKYILAARDEKFRIYVENETAKDVDELIDWITKRGQEKLVSHFRSN